MISTYKLASLLPFLSFVAAIPLDSCSTDYVTQCKPNFQGNQVSIFSLDTSGTSNDSVLEWWAEDADGASMQPVSRTLQESVLSGEFFVEFTGQPEQTYNIKLTADTSHSLLVSVSGEEVNLAVTTQGSETQAFDINCNQCTENSVAHGCQISYASTGQCVILSDDGTRLVLGSCDDGTAFHMIPQLSAGDAATVHINL